MPQCLRPAIHLILVLLAACGGGTNKDDPVDSQAPDIFRIWPSAILSSIPKFVTLEGTRFGSPGDPAVIRFTARSGTPFQAGTSATLDLPVTLATDHVTHLSTPYEMCGVQTTADVTLIRSDGVASAPEEVLLVPAVRRAEGYPAAYRYYGTSVAVEGAAVLVGAFGGRGTDFFYEIQERHLEEPLLDGHGEHWGSPAGDLTGYAVDLTATWSFVGMPTSDTPGKLPGDAGVTYVDAGAVRAAPIDWETQADPPTLGLAVGLLANDQHDDCRLGAALDASEGRLIVGAPYRTWEGSVSRSR